MVSLFASLYWHHPSLAYHPALAGTGLRIAIVHARWNMGIIGPLLEGAKKTLLASGVTEDNITVHTVPGSYELPFAVQR
jgi:6,7-dimethyl-8-ribityllumazine synthase